MGAKLPWLGLAECGMAGLEIQIAESCRSLPLEVTRRETLSLGLAGFVALGFPPPALAEEQGTDRYDTDSGVITVHPITHAFVVITVSGLVIWRGVVRCRTA